MNTSQINYFFAICKYGTYSEVSRRLYISQPSVSKQILALENELGVKLFIRKNGKNKLTPEGEIMLAAFERSKAILDEAIRNIYRLNNRDSISLRIVALQWLDVPKLLGNKLEAFRKKHPRIIVSLENLSHEELEAALHMDRYDLVITSEREVKDDRLVKFIVLGHAENAFVVPANSPLGQKDELDQELLCKYKFYMPKLSVENLRSLSGLMKLYPGFSEKNLIIVDDIDTAVLNVEMGKGITLMSTDSTLLKNKSLRLFPLENVSFNYVGAWHYKNHNPARKALIAEFTRTLK